MEATSQISGVDSILSLTRKLWFAFLSKWNQLGGSLQDTVCPNKNDGGTNLSEQSTSVHERPLPRDVASPFAVLEPSRLMLLGLINLACRLSRSWITPADLIRWCRQERIPYTQAYELLPSEMKARVGSNKKIHKIFVLEFAGAGKIHSVTPSNILFYTFELGRLLNIPIPDLNSTLVVRAMAASLGLPSYVAKTHAKVAQLLHPTVRTKKFKYHTEDIASSLFLSCQLDPRWHDWAVVTASNLQSNNNEISKETLLGMLTMDKADEAASLVNQHSISGDTLHCPVTASAADSITRSTLDLFLLQACKSLRSTSDYKPHDHMGFASFNKVVKRAFLLQPEIIGVDRNAPKSDSYQSYGVQRSYMELVSPFRNEFNTYVNEMLKSDTGRMMLDDGSLGDNLSAHVTATGVCNDLVASTRLQHLILLERVARCCQCSPAIINSILESNDEKCVGVAVDALTAFTKRIVEDCDLQYKKDRSVFRGGSLLSHGVMSLETVKNSSKLNYVKNSFNLLKRLKCTREGHPVDQIPLESTQISSVATDAEGETTSKTDELTKNKRRKRSRGEVVNAAYKKRKKDVGTPHMFHMF